MPQFRGVARNFGYHGRLGLQKVNIQCNHCRVPDGIWL